MADERKTLPKFPANRWWQLRDKFLQSLPKGPVDKQYLSTVFDIGEPAAQNLVAPLKMLGLIAEDGKVTERANLWRHDDDYKNACEQMLEIYPQGLRDVQPGPNVDALQAATWVSKNLNVGQAAATQIATLYKMIVEANVERGDESANAKVAPKAKAGETKKPLKPKRPAKSDPVANVPTFSPGAYAPDTTPQVKFDSQSQMMPSMTPTVHLDIQIHISPEASNEQIEKIFEAMGKHIFNRSKVD